ncbi:MAG: glycogen/starch/alpha-glucan phosphorylase, partial [Clostridiales bacterium]|nr:glycogen/starch/alpha-glucan phosphorylase [Clostridiales bacterium]
IKFVNEIAKRINNDPEVNEIIKVVFVQNYNVSKAELLFPAADVSEQISTAGMEASGTGNMKFMMNGALTLGTMDGANIEISEKAGLENIYIFGATVEELERIKPSYNPYWQYENVKGLKRVVDSLVDGTFHDDDSGIFRDLYNSLLSGTSWEKGDTYYVLGDFEDYRRVKDQVAEDYKDKENWNRKCWINICTSGHFSSDRTIREYATEIWKIDPIKL